MLSTRDLKYPPTAVGGINVPFRNISRKDLNHPPTAVGGIYDFEARASRPALKSLRLYRNRFELDILQHQTSNLFVPGLSGVLFAPVNFIEGLFHL